MNKKVYLTNAIPYVNASPHIGFALEITQSDTYIRYRRLLGDSVYFSAGSDENSLKNVQAAEKEGISTQQLVDKYAEKFEGLKSLLNLSYDVFNRTSNKDHFKGAQKLWSACNPEDIYKKSYTGLYCVGCEEFYTEDELIDGKCPEHHTVPDKVSEENYFFKLSNYQQQIEDLILNDKIKIIPETRKNEVLSFIKQGLRDFSISRSVARAKGWGVPVPGDDSQIMYVWFDALTTYLTALGYGSSDEKLFNEFWTNESEKIHVIGKGIVRFHAIYWIGMLLSAKLPLPNLEFVHGYVTVDGQKISKSLGNTVNPYELIEKYGTDPVRYYLLKEIPSYGDGDFSEERFREVYNADLANGLGNLVARVSKLCENITLSPNPSVNHLVKEVQTTTGDIKTEYTKLLENFRFDEALKLIWSDVRTIDQYINEQQPWKLDKEELTKVMQVVVDAIRYLNIKLQPFLPETSEKILNQFSGEIKSGAPLFPRI